MARRRMVDPEFWSDEGITSLPLGARLLAIGILNFCDDRGVFPDSPRKIRNLVFPGDPFSTEDIASWLDGLISIRYLYRFSLDGASYFKVRNWGKYQHIVNPSKQGFLPQNINIPMPDYNNPSIALKTPDIALSSSSNSPTIPLVPEVKLSKDKLREEEEEEEEAQKIIQNIPATPPGDQQPDQAPSRSKRKLRKPLSADTLTKADLLALFTEDELIEAHKKFPTFDLDWEAQACVDHWNIKGGTPFWKTTFRNWLTKADEFRKERKNGKFRGHPQAAQNPELDPDLEGIGITISPPGYDPATDRSRDLSQFG